MELKHLRSFLAVADTGNVTQAAQLLDLVQPAVSRQIRQLEEAVGVELFERSHRGVMLTEAGHTLVAYARRATLELDRARAQIGTRTHDLSGLVTVGLLPSISALVSGVLIDAITRLHPGIRLRLVTGYSGTLLGWLENGEADVALLYEFRQPLTLRTEDLVDEPLWAVGSSIERWPRAISLSGLAGRSMVLPGAPHGIRLLVERACAVSGVRLKVVVETAEMEVQKHFVRSGHGFTILPAAAVSKEVARKELVAAPLKPALTRTISLATRSARVLPPPVHSVAQTMRQCVEDAVRNGQWSHAKWLPGRRADSARIADSVGK